MAKLEGDETNANSWMQLLQMLQDAAWRRSWRNATSWFKYPTPPCALAKILPETTLRASVVSSNRKCWIQWHINQAMHIWKNMCARCTCSAEVTMFGWFGLLNFVCSTFSPIILFHGFESGLFVNKSERLFPSRTGIWKKKIISIQLEITVPSTIY